MNKSVFGLNENLAAALAYLGVYVSGIIILVLERENKFVRFAALQSTIFFATLTLLSILVGWLPILGFLLSRAIGFVGFVTLVYLVFTAYKGQAVKLPILGDICWEQVNK